MGFPNVPHIKPEIHVDRDDALDLLLMSIALEELSLAHILNAEGEKIQFALEALQQGKMKKHAIDNLLKVNRSVNSVLRNVIKEEILLQFKQENVLNVIGCEEEYDDEG
ncbi:hypothetical protein CS060_11120 [Anoxybacillus flavithermus]|uniref:Uncharacterized protein n=1 Tax=Anoxybacillus flavithermus TaxID=33934 RepID=A0A2G5RMT8_9BACL|nr:MULTISPECIES: hypothetical protein [Anoxybacillus]KFZ42611.1 hypothetical protein JS80_09050 [Anoxybacillus sp. KU2-6(11)]PIC04148.1 hypothetical protein CS060_11120 [Anoxybacillus flavithermus]